MGKGTLISAIRLTREEETYANRESDRDRPRAVQKIRKREAKEGKECGGAAEKAPQ